MIVAVAQLVFLVLKNYKWIRSKGMIDAKMLGELQ